MSLNKRRIIHSLVLVVVTGLLLLSAGGALAQGPPVEKETQRLVNETSTTIDAHPWGWFGKLVGIDHETRFAPSCR
jgi:hypothetical protein